METNKGSLDYAIDRMTWYTERIKENGKLGFDSPFKKLDAITRGVIPGKVITVGAYSNVGKSKFSYNYVNSFIDSGLKVLFFSLEVDVGMLLLNILCNRYKKSFSEAEHGIEFDYRELHNLKLYDDVYDMQEIEDITLEEKPDVVFIDYVQNINISGGTEYEKMSAIAKRIQRLAIKSNSAVISISQLSNTEGKEVSKGKTDFVSLKGAGEFFSCSDVIFILRRGENGDVILKIQKNKYGPAGGEHTFKVDFSKSLYTYTGEYMF